MAATVNVQYYSGAGPTGANAETGIKFNREDTQTGTTPIPVPTATGTNFSWHKALGLHVSAADATSISNRRIRYNGSMPTGVKMWFYATPTYVQASSGTKPTDNASTNDATPTDPTDAQAYTELTTADQVYDAAAESANATRLNGEYVQVVLGIANTFAGGAGSAHAAPDIIFTFDES